MVLDPLPSSLSSQACSKRKQHDRVNRQSLNKVSTAEFQKSLCYQQLWVLGKEILSLGALTCNLSVDKLYNSMRKLPSQKLNYILQYVKINQSGAEAGRIFVVNINVYCFNSSLKDSHWQKRAKIQYIIVIHLRRKDTESSKQY